MCESGLSRSPGGPTARGRYLRLPARDFRAGYLTHRVGQLFRQRIRKAL